MTTVPLTVPNEILTPGTHLWSARVGNGTPDGEAVVIHAQGKFRRAVIVKVGPKRATVAFATSGTAYREKAVPHALIYAMHPADESERERYGVIRQGSGGPGQHLEGAEDVR